MVVGGQADNGYPSGDNETFDPSSGAWNYTYSLPSIGLVSHTTTLLPGGKLLVAGGSSGRVAAITLLYDWPDGTWEGTWSTTGALTAARDQHTTTLLPNGKVLAVGGAGTSSPLSNSDLYDPASGIWTATGSLHDARQWHTATLLTNGQVLAAGGSGGSGPLASAESYNPASGTWARTNSLQAARFFHTATLLANGKVLAAGGGGNSGFVASAELFDPASGAWTTTGSLNTNRSSHTATLLPNGQVLVAGGWNGSPMASSELYNPAAGTWATSGPLHTARQSHTATLLPNGQILVVGGYNGALLASAELYNPASGTWTNSGSLNTARQCHTATLLPNGKVLVAGGISSSGWATNSAELYDPASGVWTPTGSLNSAREYPTATLLPSGKVLLAGGYNTSMLASAELYDIGWGFSSSWQPQIATFTSPLAVNGSLALTGSNFRGMSEGSGGNGNQDSPADYPVVQLRRLDNEQTVFLLSTSWQTNSYTSAPVSGLSAGWAMLTVFVNGIPSQSSVLLVQPAITVTIPPFRITNPTKVAGGAYQFTFTNTPGGSFTVLAATNAALSLSGWSTAGAATEVSSGRYQFSDPQAGTTPRRFYRVRSP